jgi:NADP-dependent 3-hydroxy acid dehydrogenase YdfG
VEAVANPEVRAQLVGARDKLAMATDAIAGAIAFAIEQPLGVDVGEIVVLPTAQS